MDNKDDKSKIHYEIWIRLRCPCDPKKPIWTFLPLKELPDYFVCVVCRGRNKIKDILQTGQEIFKRGDKKDKTL